MPDDRLPISRMTTQDFEDRRKILNSTVKRPLERFLRQYLDPNRPATRYFRLTKVDESYRLLLVEELLAFLERAVELLRSWR